MADLLPNDPDNLAPAYAQQAQTRELQGLLQEAKMTAGLTNKPAKEEEDPADPKGISLKGVLKDVGMGLIEGIPQIAGGALDAGQEVLESMDSLADYLNENVLDTTLPGVGKDDMELNLPKIGEAKSVTGNVIRKASQFLTSFIPTLQAIKRTTGAAKGVGYIAQVTGAGAITDAFAFDPHEERLSNLAKDMGVEWQLTDYLAADPSDSEAEGRFKNALEGTGLGVVTDGIFHAAKGIRAWHISRGTQPPKFEADVPEGMVRLYRAEAADKVEPAEWIKQGRKELGIDEAEGRWFTRDKEALEWYRKDAGGPAKSRVVTVDVPKDEVDNFLVSKNPEAAKFSRDPDNEYFVPREVATKAKDINLMRTEVPAFQSALIKSEPKRPLLTDMHVADKLVNGKATADDLAKALDFSHLNSPENIAKVVNRFARISKEANDLVPKGKMPANTGRPPTVTDKEVIKAADALGITPAQVLGSQSFLKGNKALDAERIVAMGKLLDASVIKVTELAEKATTSTDTKDLFDFVKMMHIHSAMQQYFKGASSEAGRALRALQIPSGNLSKQLSMLNESLTGLGGPSQIKKVAEAIKKVKGDKKKLAKVLDNSFKKKFSDTLVSVWYFQLLSGLKTHAANVLSTGLNAAWQVPERYLASKISTLRGSADGVKEGEAAQLMFGYINAFQDGLRGMRDVIRTGEQADLLGGKAERMEPRQRAVSGSNYGLGNAPEGDPRWFMGKAFDALGLFLEAPTRAIMAEDEFFRIIGKSGEMHALAFRQAATEGLEGDAMAKRMLEIMENPSEEFLGQVDTFMRDLTFSSPLGEFGQSVMRLTNAHPILKIALPFVRTPINLLKAAGRRNFITGPLMGSVQADLRKGGAARDLALARMALGSMVSLVFVNQALSGNITGAGPSGYGDKALQNAWRVNHQPYSVKIGDTWYGYNRLDPMGTMLGAVATYAELAAQADNDTVEELAGAIAIATSQTVFNKTWMKGPAELLEAFTQPDRYGEKWITNALGTLLVGQGVAQITQQHDPVWRDVNSALDAVKSRIPGLSDTLPPRRNMWGEPIHMEGGLGPDVISPVYSQNMRNDKISQFITDNKVAIDLPTRTQLNVELTPHEYSEFVEKSGKPAHEKLTAIMEGKDALSEQWRSGTDGPDGSRALIVKTVIQNYRDQARAMMLNGNPDLQRRVRLFHEDRAKALRGK